MKGREGHEQKKEDYGGGEMNKEIHDISLKEEQQKPSIGTHWGWRRAFITVTAAHAVEERGASRGHGRRSRRTARGGLLVRGWVSG